MPNQIDLYSQEILKITEKGDSHTIVIAGRYSEGSHTFIIKKEELVAIYMEGEAVRFYFKTFPSILAKLSNNKKVMENLSEFIKKVLINDTKEIDLLSI
jgi:hypothetical protein